MISPQTNPARPRRLGWIVHLLLIAFIPIAVFVLNLGHGKVRTPALTHSVAGLLYVCAIQICIFALIFGLAWICSRASREDLLLNWRPGRWVIPLGIGYSLALRLALALLGLFIIGFLLATRIVTPAGIENFGRMNAPEVEALVDVSALRNNPVYLALTLTLVSFVLAGLREELWRSAFIAGFRHLWPRHFEGRRGEIKAVVFAAIVFGGAHAIQGPVAVVLTGLLGLGLGAIMVFHRSIWPAVIAHGFFDATSLALLPLVDGLQKIQKTALWD
jgi:membrane protease YdiL (CAAX protease family)